MKFKLNGIHMSYEKCVTIDDVIDALKELPIASAQTLTVADRNGKIIVAECNPKHLEIIEPRTGEQFVATANNFNSEKIRPYRTPPYIDSWRSDERYQTAKNALKDNSGNYSLNFAENLLAGKYGFMCQYDRKKNADTVWSVIYDVKNLRFYRVEGNPSRKKYIEDLRMSF